MEIWENKKWKPDVIAKELRNATVLGFKCFLQSQTRFTGWHTYNGAGKNTTSKFMKGVNKSSL